jgi:hypothetical protein
MRFWESWLRKKLGVTPEVLARARQDERTARTRARALPFAVNRQVLVLLPRDRFFVWKSQWDALHTKGSPEPACGSWIDSALADEPQVNAYTTGEQLSPAVAVDGAGNFVVVWESYGSGGTDTDYSSIQARRFGKPLFVDRFESGDTSAW